MSLSRWEGPVTGPKSPDQVTHLIGSSLVILSDRLTSQHDPWTALPGTPLPSRHSIQYSVPSTPFTSLTASGGTAPDWATCRRSDLLLSRHPHASAAGGDHYSESQAATSSAAQLKDTDSRFCHLHLSSSHPAPSLSPMETRHFGTFPSVCSAYLAETWVPAAER